MTLNSANVTSVRSYLQYYASVLAQSFDYVVIDKTMFWPCSYLMTNRTACFNFQKHNVVLILYSGSL